MSVALSQLEILTESIQDNYVMGKWQDISLPLQEYKFASRLFDQAKKDEMGGENCKWKLETDYADNFQVVELYHRDSSDRKDVLTEGSMPWALTTANYHYDLDEAVFTRGLPEIVDYISLREKGLNKSFFAGMEDLMFADGPTGPSQRPMPPATLLYWLQASATEGFNGGDPTGWGDVGAGNILTGSYENWKNRTFSYAVVDHEHFVKPIVRSLDKCDFKPMPIPMNDIVPQGRFNWELLTTYSRVELCRDMLRSGNDNIKADLGTWMNSVMIRNVPMTWVPAWTNSNSINARTDGIVLGVNWATFKWYYQSSRNMRKRKPFQHPDMSLVRIRCMDDSGQIVCFDRRRNFRGYSTVAVTETD
jgi:hypothetical protein